MAEIRPASEAESLEILKHPTVLPLLQFDPIAVKDSVEKYILGEKALLIVIPLGRAAEVHIACKLRDRAGLMPLFHQGLRWLKERGFSEVITTAPEGRTALKNMLKSIGFKQTNDYWSYTWE